MLLPSAPPSGSRNGPRATLAAYHDPARSPASRGPTAPEKHDPPVDWRGPGAQAAGARQK